MPEWQRASKDLLEGSGTDLHGMKEALERGREAANWLIAKTRVTELLAAPNGLQIYSLCQIVSLSTLKALKSHNFLFNETL